MPVSVNLQTTSQEGKQDGNNVPSFPLQVTCRLTTTQVVGRLRAKGALIPRMNANNLAHELLSATEYREAKLFEVESETKLGRKQIREWRVPVVVRTIGSVFTTEPLKFGRATLKGCLREARKHNLSLCPPFAAPYLREAYTGQPVGEVLLVAMCPISLQGINYVFTLENRDGRLLLGAVPAGDHLAWYPDRKVVFAETLLH